MSETHDPPHVPDVVDEAADTPPWLPKVGVALLLAVVVYVAVMRGLEAHRSTAPAGRAPAAQTE